MKTTVLATALAFAAGVSAFGSRSHRLSVAASNSTSFNASTATPIAPRQDPWYSAPVGYESAAPGAILKIRPALPALLQVTANASAAYNLLYRTTNSQYKPSWAVTTLFIPTNPDPSKFLSYQIPYDSVDLNASPSYALYTSPEADISKALGQGWFVSSPDYEGPNASFTAGVTSGHGTLDGVRAVLSSGFGLNTTSAKYALWGYSGGALASEWGLELQNQYAPELNFSGAALGGLTPNVTSVLFTINKSIYAGLAPAGILGLSSQYPSLASFVIDHLKRNGTHNITGFLNDLNYTLDQGVGAFLNQDIGDYFNGGLALINSPVAQYVINRDGIMGHHGVPAPPLFVYKAIGDDISVIADTDNLVKSYCSVGANIKYDRNTVGDHDTEEVNGDPRAFSFLTSILAGTWNQTSGCVVHNVTVNLTGTA